MSQRQPMLARRRLQRAERTDGTVAGTVRSADGFDEQVIGVGLAADCLARRLKEHFVPIYTEIGADAREKCKWATATPATLAKCSRQVQIHARILGTMPNCR